MVLLRNFAMRELPKTCGHFFTILMPKYGSTFVQVIYVEFKNMSCYIILLGEIFRKAFKMSARGRNNCNKCPVEETSGRNFIGLTVVWRILRKHLGKGVSANAKVCLS